MRETVPKPTLPTPNLVEYGSEYVSVRLYTWCTPVHVSRYTHFGCPRFMSRLHVERVGPRSGPARRLRPAQLARLGALRSLPLGPCPQLAAGQLYSGRAGSRRAAAGAVAARAAAEHGARATFQLVEELRPVRPQVAREAGDGADGNEREADDGDERGGQQRVLRAATEHAAVRLSERGSERRARRRQRHFAPRQEAVAAWAAHVAVSRCTRSVTHGGHVCGTLCCKPRSYTSAARPPSSGRSVEYAAASSAPTDRSCATRHGERWPCVTV